jgi:hypothetical protein
MTTSSVPSGTQNNTHIPWLYRHWPALWGVMMLASSIALWLAFGSDLFSQPFWYAWLLIPVAWAHEFEEYFIGNFWRWYNRTCFKSKEDFFPLTHKRAFFINAGSVVPLLLQAFLVESFPALTLFLLITLHMNAWFHITYTVGEGRYSPGTVTSLLLYLPLTTYALYDMLLITQVVTPAGFIAGVALAFGSGFGLFGYLRRIANNQPERLYPTYW